MACNTQQKYTLTNNIHRKALALAISMCFATALPVFAQSIEGSIFGLAKAKGSVQILNLETGLARTLAADANGAFTFNKLPPGRYQITADGDAREVNVAIGSGTEVKFVDAGTKIATVNITGTRSRNKIDVSSTEASTVFTLAEIQALPVGRNATAVSLLTPGAVAGDKTFGKSVGNLASFSGASVAENGYYINGLDVTNMRNFTNYASLPFEAISQQQIKSGGYGAEFGRSLGGVVSISTKRGTNEWKGGVSTYWTPSWGQASGRSVKNLDPDVNEDYQKYSVFDPKEGNANYLTYNAYLGGPIIKDKLFIFGLVEGRRDRTENYYESTSSSTSAEVPRGVLKLDWHIADGHRLEYTGISNKRATSYRVYNNLEDDEKYATRHIGPATEYKLENGGDVQILKYTGYLTDNLTLSAQIGRTYNVLDKRDSASALGADCPYVVDSNGAYAWGCWSRDTNNYIIRDPNAPDDSDTRKAKRLDLEYTLGSHTIRAGWDAQDFISTDAGETYSGGIAYTYYKMPASGTINGVPNAGTPGNKEYVRVRKYYSSTGSFLAKNDAFYVEDSWKADKNVLLYGGLRFESFDNRNKDNQSFVKRDNLLAPRFGVSWDVNGDSSLKVYGNAGRYFIPVATSANKRVSTARYSERRFYNFNGVDSRTLAPLNLGPEIGQAIISGSYPLRALDPGKLADTKLKPMNQDEFILGFQKAIDKGWSYGVKGVYRKVNDGMDDYCAAGGIDKFMKEKGYGNFDFQTLPLVECMIMNPGRDLNINVDANNDGKLIHVTIPNSYLGLKKYERTYRGLELTIERPFDGKWGVSGSYVYAVNKGTSEGYVQSDFEQGDAGTTMDFDFGSFTHGASGILPNNRTHQIKMYGNYAINDNFRLGANLSLNSGRRTSCMGFVPPTVADFNGPAGTSQGGSRAYTDAASYYCLNSQGTSVLGSRGNGRLLPWTKQIDLSSMYTMKLENGRTLTLQANIFNVFNTQTVTMINQVRDYSRDTSLEASGNKLNPNYERPTNFMTPRSVSFSGRYEF